MPHVKSNNITVVYTFAPVTDYDDTEAHMNMLISPCDAMLAECMLWPDVCGSQMYCIKMTACITMQPMLHGSLGILVF